MPFIDDQLVDAHTEAQIAFSVDSAPQHPLEGGPAAQQEDQVRVARFGDRVRIATGRLANRSSSTAPASSRSRQRSGAAASSSARTRQMNPCGCRVCGTPPRRHSLAASSGVGGVG